MKNLTRSDYLRIISRRDPRFDGTFYLGVRTTGIYCRPTCPARPKAKNIEIFQSAAEAQRAGYRACLRCHPDLPPTDKRVQGSSYTASKGFELIERLAEEDLDLNQVAGSLGVTSRQLRRTFNHHLGVSPRAAVTARRLQLAKRLLRESPASITEIAFAAGFQSIRRFNEAFRAHYHRSPSQLRK